MLFQRQVLDHPPVVRRQVAALEPESSEAVDPESTEFPVEMTGAAVEPKHFDHASGPEGGISRSIRRTWRPL